MVRLWTDAKPSSTAHAQGEPPTTAPCEVAEMMESQGTNSNSHFPPPKYMAHEYLQTENSAIPQEYQRN